MIISMLEYTLFDNEDISTINHITFIWDPLWNLIAGTDGNTKRYNVINRWSRD